MVTTTSAPVRIDPDALYRPRELARLTGTGPQTWYRPIRDGRLRASKLNDRGDLVLRGAWIIAYLESLANNVQTA